MQQAPPNRQAQIDLDDLDSLIFDSSFALTDTDVLNWCKVNGMPQVKVTDLKVINETGKSRNRQQFIFTGAKDDEYNRTNDHHWLAHDGNLVFDSYGALDEYKLPSNFVYFPTQPQRLQEFNTSVCGAYCCAFFDFLNNNPSASSNQQSLEELGDLFSQEYGFGNNRKENDKTILAWYIRTGGKFSNPQPIKPDISPSEIGQGTEKTQGSSQESFRERRRRSSSEIASPSIHEGEEAITNNC